MFKQNLLKLFFILTIIFGILFIVLLTILWNALNYDYIPNLKLIENVANQEYDYIIVGAGTAGSVLANRLSANQNVSVLLIEAGEQFGALSIIPIFTTIMQNKNVDWNFITTSQQHTFAGMFNRQQHLPRGKGLGGTSQLNYMLHSMGLPKDYDKMEMVGGSGWSYKELKKYLSILDDYHNKNDNHHEQTQLNCLNVENFDHQPNFIGNHLENIATVFGINKRDKNLYCFDDIMGKNINIDDNTESTDYLLRTKVNDNPLTKSMAEAIEEIQEITDDGHRKQYDLSMPVYNINKGIRWSVYHSYLRPAFKRNNLHILLNTRVHKVNIKNRKANSVVITSSNDDDDDDDPMINKWRKKITKKVYAKNEIILSAGVFQSPTILKHSGIGPIAELTKFKINPLVDSPNVGENLYDHLQIPLYVSINESLTITREKVLTLTNVIKYLWNGNGDFANLGGIGHVTTLTNDDYGTSIYAIGTVDEQILKEISNYKTKTFESIFPLYLNASQEGLVILATCNQPKSRGTIKLIKKSKTNPMGNPEINPNYLQHPDDRECMKNAIRLSVRIIKKTNAFKKYNPIIHWPTFNECKNFGPTRTPDGLHFSDEQNDRYLDCYITMVTLTAHHSGGTCSIGNHSDSVLDTEFRFGYSRDTKYKSVHSLDNKLIVFRVRGIDKLRVIDGSSIPNPISGTPNTLIAAIAEYGSDILLNKMKLTFE